jgi:hypothetical protein
MFIECMGNNLPKRLINTISYRIIKLVKENT